VKKVAKYEIMRRKDEECGGMLSTDTAAAGGNVTKLTFLLSVPVLLAVDCSTSPTQKTASEV
jgi:hypothetical protein